MNRFRQVRGEGLIVPLALLLFWQAAAIWQATPLFPGPWDVTKSLVRHTPEILSELGITLLRAAAGFLVAAVLMIPLGVFLGRFRRIGTLVEPLIDMIATLPPPAVVPIVMLFAGTGDAAKIVVIAYAAAIPLLINTTEAARTIHPMAGQVARALHLSRIETMRLVDLPSSLPMVVTGARLAIASSLLVSVTSEMLLATDGIGVFLQKRQELFQISAGLAGIAYISLAGLLINAGLVRLERRWLFWHYRRRDAG